MEVEVRIHGTDLADAVRNYTARRLHFALGRFASRIGRIVVRISDTNGVRGGIDLRPSGQVVLDQTDADLFTAIDRASERVGRAFLREIQRTRQARTGRESVRTRTR